MPGRACHSCRSNPLHLRCKCRERVFPLVPLLNNIIVNIFDRANIQASCRVDSYQQIFVILHFTRNNDFLLVASREGACRTFFAVGRADIEIFNGFCRVIKDRFALQKTILGIRTFFIVLKNQIVLNGKVQQQSVFLAVSRDTGNTVIKSESG